MSDHSTNTTHFSLHHRRRRGKKFIKWPGFHSVAAKYDVMNDLMSVGLHRVWKIFTIAQAVARFQSLGYCWWHWRFIKEFVKQTGKSGEVWHTDINESMLRVGRDRLLNKGLITPTLLCDAESYLSPITILIVLVWPLACAI